MIVLQYHGEITYYEKYMYTRLTNKKVVLEISWKWYLWCFILFIFFVVVFGFFYEMDKLELPVICVQVLTTIL